MKRYWPALLSMQKSLTSWQLFLISRPITCSYCAFYSLIYTNLLSGYAGLFGRIDGEVIGSKRE